VLIDGDLDDASQIAVCNRFEQVAERLRELGAADGLDIRMRGNVYDRRTELRLQGSGGFDAVHPAFEPYVHENQVERCGPDTLDRLFARTGDSGLMVTQPLKPPLNVGGDEPLVFDDQNLFVEIIVNRQVKPPAQNKKAAGMPAAETERRHSGRSSLPDSESSRQVRADSVGQHLSKVAKCLIISKTAVRKNTCFSCDR
jgi:hypothetical protein